MSHTLSIFGAKPPPNKSPGDTLDFSLRWTRYLDGATIASLAVAVKGLTLVDDSRVGDLTTAVVSGGKVGRVAWIEFTITLDLVPVRVVVRRLPIIVRPA